jgi:hypothetical protein
MIRSKAKHLGTVEAVDRERAEATAIKQFDLDSGQRRPAAGPGAALARASAREPGNPLKKHHKSCALGSTGMILFR